MAVPKPYVLSLLHRVAYCVEELPKSSSHMLLWLFGLGKFGTLK
jgi:hypothetical protein